MKKVFFSFAIATMMASLVACGGQSGQNAEGQDSTAVEAEAEEAEEPAEEAQPQATDELVGPQTIERDEFDFNIPEGWTGKNKKFLCSMTKNNENGTTVVDVVIKSINKAFDEDNQTYGLTKADKVATEKLGDLTWSIYVQGIRVNAAALSADKQKHLFVSGTMMDGYIDDLKTALSNIKMK